MGGLGESVTDDDLRRMFGPLGVAEGVDILRTKGRSFAYVDFCPSSLNSVSKLFSTVLFLLYSPLRLCIFLGFYFFDGHIVFPDSLSMPKTTSFFDTHLRMLLFPPLHVVSDSDS